MTEFSHLDPRGAAHMVDVGAKAVTARRAVAEGRIRMRPQTAAAISAGDHAKGDVLAAARLAGIMAAKRTAELIPLCHPIALDQVEVELQVEEASVYCRATVAASARTGVEMEALTAVQIALLTVYDMCKAADRAMSIEAVRLLSKTGGACGDWRRPSD